MQVTSKGQVTIPREIRNRLGLLPHTKVEFELAGDHARIRKARHPVGESLRGRMALELLRGTADTREHGPDSGADSRRERPRQAARVTPALAGLPARHPPQRIPGWPRLTFPHSSDASSRCWGAPLPMPADLKGDAATRLPCTHVAAVTCPRACGGNLAIC
jgi:AbrB family looped-hinge helix DNA binding protein